MTGDAPERERRAAQIATLRAYHRGARNAGFVACLAGALLMIAGRFVSGAPHWALFAGLGGIVLGWALFGYSIFKRAAWARAHPFDSNG